MTEALIWKEWREHRPLLLLGAGVVLAIPLLAVAISLSAGDAGYAEVLEGLGPRVSATLIWPMLAAMFGAFAFGAERGGRTMDFLASRPISRTRLWAIKVGTAAVCQLLVMAISGGLVGVLAQGAGRPFLSVAFSEWEWAPVSCFVLFSSALFASSWASRPLAAAAMAAVLATVTFVLATVIPGALIIYRNAVAEALGGPRVPVLYGGAETLAVLMGLAAAGFLLYSLWRFAGDELRHGSRARLLAVASGIVAIGLSSSLAPPAIAQWALSPAWGDIMDIALSPDGSTVALTVETRSRRQAQIWWASVPDSEGSRLSGRRSTAFEPFFSPDGSTVAYFTGRDTRTWGSFEGLDLWVARPDGSKATRVAEDVPRFGTGGPPLQAMFASDARSVAVLRDSALSLISVTNAQMGTIDTREHLGTEIGAWLIAGSDDGSEVFVAGRGGGDVREWHRVIAVDFNTRAIRTIARFSAGGSARWLGIVALPTRDHLVFSSARALSILDTASGAMTEVTDRSCAAGMSRRGLYYVTCEQTEDQGVVSTLHFWDSSIGAGVPVADFSGTPADRLVPDATGERIAVATGRRRRYNVLVFDREGAVVSSFRSTLAPLHWTADGRIVTADFRRIRIIEPTTGEGYEPGFE